jgi:thiol-disulfide isomerase/thioredoxin
MKRLYALLAALCFSTSLVVGITSTSLSQEIRVTESPLIYNLFSNIVKEVKAAKSNKADRLLVISEPSWCPPCRNLEPHLAQLKKEGYDVYTYTMAEWKKAKPKPGNLPQKVKDGKNGVPVVMYVVTNGNKVVRDHQGGPTVTANYIKRHLTK